MNTGLQSNNTTIVAHFHAVLQRQGLVVLLLLALLALGWNVLQVVRIRGESKGREWREAPGTPEPVARRVLRVSFGLLWILDGLLQAQQSMPLGMTTQVIRPGAAASPSWVQHVVNFGATIWSNHPITAPTSAVWIQVGLGLWLLVAPQGRWSRFAGLASAGWGLVVWVFGESFGGIFAPGLSWAFGAPGAVLFYCLAGLLIALPGGAWSRPRLGKVILGVLGTFFVGMAVLQAWPGRGFWQGQLTPRGASGTLTAMVRAMAQTPQPRPLASLVSDFAGFDAAHGWAVNLFLLVSLAVVGIALLSGRPSVVRVGVIGGAVLCVADWIFIEDFGFLGGVGTDPNSMIPMTLIFIAGYLALTKLPATKADGPVPITSARSASVPLAVRLAARPTYTFRAAAGVFAIAIMLIGAAPMALASTDSTADPILSQAFDGTPGVVNYPAPTFSLVDQHGHVVTLPELRGKVVVLSFLDPVCVSDCPVIAQELRVADQMLGSAASRVEFVAVVINPVYRSRAYLTAFDRQEGLDRLTNWLFLTGSPSRLQHVWGKYGVQVYTVPGGAMIAHNDVAYIIDATGQVRYILDSNPGPSTQTTESSTSNVLSGLARSVLP